MRPVVGQERKRNAAEEFRPAFEARRGIGADLQYFDVQLLEFFEVRTEPGDLILSSTREGEGKERDHGGPTAETGERDLVAVVGRELEVRRCATWLKCHASSPLSFKTAMPPLQDTTKG